MRILFAVLSTAARHITQTRAPNVPRDKAQKHVLTAYNRDNQMLMRRKKVCLACLRLPRLTIEARR